MLTDADLTAELRLELFTAEGAALTPANLDDELCLFLEDCGVQDVDLVEWEVEEWPDDGAKHGTCVVFTGPADVVKELAHWVSEETGELVLPKILD